MQRLPITDFFLNAVLPVILGLGVYYAAYCFKINEYVRNELPDGLWSYSLMSSILIVWERKINFFWTVIIFCFCVLFEILQELQLINGTGACIDIAIYFVFLMLALITNKYFLTAFKIKYENTY